MEILTTNCPSRGRRAARQRWIPAPGICALEFEDEGWLIVDANRGKVTWRGEPVAIVQDATVTVLYGLAAGFYGPAPMPAPPCARRQTIGQVLGRLDMWVEKFRIVKGWEGAPAARTIIDDQPALEAALRPRAPAVRRLTASQRRSVELLAERGHSGAQIAHMMGLEVSFVTPFVISGYAQPSFKEIRRLEPRKITENNEITGNITSKARVRAL